MTDIQHSVIAYADARELTVVRQLVHAVRDAISLKATVGLPVLSETRAAIDDVEGRYVVLRAGGGVLAVYRIRNDGMLKRLRRWPRELEQR